MSKLEDSKRTMEDTAYKAEEILAADTVRYAKELIRLLEEPIGENEKSSLISELETVVEGLCLTRDKIDKVEPFHRKATQGVELHHIENPDSTKVSTTESVSSESNNDTALEEIEVDSQREAPSEEAPDEPSEASSEGSSADKSQAEAKKSEDKKSDSPCKKVRNLLKKHITSPIKRDPDGKLKWSPADTQLYTSS